MFVPVFMEHVAHGLLSGCFLLTDKPIIGQMGARLI